MAANLVPYVAPLAGGALAKLTAALKLAGIGGAGLTLASGVPYLFDSNSIRRDLLKKPEDELTGERDYNLLDEIRIRSSGYAPDTGEAEKITDEYMSEIKKKRAAEKAEALIEEARALAAAKELDPTFKREGEILERDNINEAMRIGNDRRQIDNALKIAQDTAGYNYQTLKNQYELNRATLQQAIAEAEGRQQLGLAELDLRRQMEEQKMQQFREQREFDRVERKEKRIQMIMEVLNGLTRPRY